MFAIGNSNDVYVYQSTVQGGNESDFVSIIVCLLRGRSCLIVLNYALLPLCTYNRYLYNSVILF